MSSPRGRSPTKTSVHVVELPKLVRRKMGMHHVWVVDRSQVQVNHSQDPGRTTSPQLASSPCTPSFKPSPPKRHCLRDTPDTPDTPNMPGTATDATPDKPGTPGMAPATPSPAPCTPGQAPGTPSMGAPGTPGMAPGTPGAAPGTPGMAAPGTPGTAPSTPGMAPSTPGMAPGTPGAAPGIPGMAAPGRPGTAPSTHGITPSTPGMAPGTPGAAPGTPGMAAPGRPGTAPSTPSTPGMAPGTPGAAPGTPGMAAPGRPGMAPSTPGMTPSTPSTPGMAPGTPGAAPGTPSMAAPGTPGMAPDTPGMAPSTSSMAPSTPGMAPGTPGAAPGTSGMAPSTPGMAPTTPGMAAPGTPGIAPGTPGMAPGTPGMAPGTPGMAPGTPGAAPGTPSMACGEVKLSRNSTDEASTEQRSRDSSTESSSVSKCSDSSRSRRPKAAAWPAVWHPTFHSLDTMHAANLQAWYHCAVQRAECRSAPTEEICCLGCCCRRCIGLPAAFRRPKVRLVPRKAKEASSDTESTTSLSSDEESDAPMAPQAPAQRPEVNFVQGEVSDRTLYCGNLGGEASVADVREAFQQRFRLLPAFQEKYLKHGVSHVVVQVNMGKGRGNFAFITFFDPQLASTALLFNGMSLCGRRLVITWPMDYTPPHDGALPGLDVAPLRRLGMLPQAPRDRRPDRPDRGPDLGKAARATSKAPKPKSLRHIFIGNMPEGQDSMQEVSELVTCFCSELPSFRQELGPAMLGAAPRGGGWLVEMQSPELAMEAARCLREVILSGRTLSVYLTFGRDLDISSAGG